MCFSYPFEPKSHFDEIRAIDFVVEFFMVFFFDEKSYLDDTGLVTKIVSVVAGVLCFVAGA